MKRSPAVAGDVWVVKVGSALLTHDGQGLNEQLVRDLVNDIAVLRSQGKKIVLVSSGAVAQGMHLLGLKTRPRAIHSLQAAAAVGQMGLIQSYQSSFTAHGLRTAQVLLTHDDLRSRKRYLNARITLTTLMELGVIPIVNENDTVATDEIRFGDNDTLAALVTNLIEASALIILTDQQGLFESNPRVNPGAKMVVEALASDKGLDQMAGEGGELGRGGMTTKLQASRIAARSGAHTFVCSGRETKVLQGIANGAFNGTFLKANKPALAARKQWLATLPLEGTLTLDDGAVAVLEKKGRSLLAVGVISVKGDFTRGELVSCVDPSGREIVRGLTNYSSAELARIAGEASQDIEAILGYFVDEEVIHRDNLFVV